MIIALILGAIIGFISAIPVAGPVSAMVLSYGMSGRYSEGRSLALGAGVVEGIYCFIAFVGFQKFLQGMTLLIQIAHFIAAILLFILGIYFYRSKKMRDHQTVQHVATLKNSRSFLLGVGVAGSNFTLLVTWTAFATTLYSLNIFEFHYPQFLAFAVGLISGIYFWFSVLIRLIARYRHRFEASILDKLLKTIGFFLIGVGVWVAYDAVSKMV